MKQVPLKPGYHWQGYKIKIYPTDEQKEYIDKCIYLSRFVYNWAVEKQEQIYEDYKNGKSEKYMYSVIDLNKMLAEFRNDIKHYWLRTLTITSCRYQILNVKNAYDMFFNKKCVNRRPKIKSKKDFKDYGSYYVRPDRMYFRGSLLKVDGLKTMIETEWDSGWYGRYDDNVKKVVGIPEFHKALIKKTPSYEYFICFNIQEPIKRQAIEFFDKDHVIGIDINVKDRFVCSNGYRSGSPDLKKLERHKAKKQTRYSKDLERKLA